ncbi:MAG: hypothetical protein OEX83_04535 [Gammaproteobacteria bacterium]|nr:hypothetical protein [Gammaproteobacteria bacterium]
MLMRLLMVFYLLMPPFVIAEEGNSILLMFQEKEADSEPYNVRMIIKGNLMRIDEGSSDNEFVLFNKDEGAIYSVSAGRKSIFIIKPVMTKTPPALKVELSVEKLEKMIFPLVAGNKPQAYKLNANGKTCGLVIAVPGMLDKALAMMRDYYTLLSYEQADLQVEIPVEMTSACDVARNIVAPARHLSFGFPIRESTSTGKQRSLLDFDENYKADVSLFVLPQDYSRFSRQGTTLNNKSENSEAIN